MAPRSKSPEPSVEERLDVLEQALANLADRLDRLVYKLVTAHGMTPEEDNR